MSAPSPPSRVSLPSPPSSLSLPLPPFRVSSPAPPSKVSLPLPPTRVTSTASRASLPWPPSRVLPVANWLRMLSRSEPPEPTLSAFPLTVTLLAPSWSGVTPSTNNVPFPASINEPPSTSETESLDIFSMPPNCCKSRISCEGSKSEIVSAPRLPNRAINVSLPSPPISVSTPPSPTSVSSPAPPTSVSSPDPPSRKSSPAPPSSVSSPLRPARRSSPAPPSTMSLPSPPSSLSLPSPPSSLSSPLRPLMVSSPAPPSRVSLPVLPIIRSSPLPPTTVPPPVGAITSKILRKSESGLTSMAWPSTVILPAPSWSGVTFATNRELPSPALIKVPPSISVRETPSPRRSTILPSLKALAVSTAPRWKSSGPLPAFTLVKSIMSCWGLNLAIVSEPGVRKF